jgi:hypothetical protein
VKARQENWRISRNRALKGGAGWKHFRGRLNVDQPYGVQNPYSVESARVNAVHLDTTFSADIAAAHCSYPGHLRRA